MWRKNKQRILWVGLSLLTLATAASADPLKIININVGHGDATLVIGATDASGHRSAVLLDAGPVSHSGQDNGQRIAKVLAENHIRVLDYFIASHYDLNHLGGFISGGPLGNSFMDGPDGKAHTPDDIRVNFFVDRGDISTLEPVTENRVFEAYRDQVETAQGERVPLRFNHIQLVAHGCSEALSTQEKLDCFTIDLGDQARMDALAGNGFVRGGKNKQVPGSNSENERSLTFLITKNRFNFLIGGDLTGHDGVIGQARDNAKLEEALGRYLHRHGVKVDVLHVNGHGSPHSAEWQFLKLVRPKVAIISVGEKNPQSLPSVSALSRLINVGILRIYQTNRGHVPEKLPLSISERQVVLNDDIVISTDGTEYHVANDRYKTNP